MLHLRSVRCPNLAPSRRARPHHNPIPNVPNPKPKPKPRQDARDYIMLAEMANGAVELPIPYEEIWGDALAELQEQVHEK